MLIKEARDIAQQWVFEEAVKEPGFYGAFIAGSTNFKHDSDELPPASDVDIKIVIENLSEHRGFKKIIYHGVLLEISHISSDQFQTPEAMLSSYPFAKHFTVNNILADPSGKLTEVQAVVARDYAKHKWVHKRCEDAFEWLNTSLSWFDPSDQRHDRIFCWAYPFGVATHVLVMPDLRYPTVRQMFVASGEVLQKYGYEDFHEQMLTLFGSANLSRELAQQMLDNCVKTLDIAKHFAKTYFFGASNISDQGRPTVAEGTQTMIDRGFHREAALWIMWNHNWARQVLVNDAPAEILAQAEPDFWKLLNALGVYSDEDLQAKHAALKAFVPRVWEVTEAILTANPEVVD